MGRSVVVSVFCLFLGLAGCAGNRAPAPVPAAPAIRGAPDWVGRGSLAVKEKNTRLFRGVGQAPVMDEPSLQNSVADNRARGEVAFLVNKYLERAAADYAAHHEQVDEAEVSRQLQGALQPNRSVRIAGRWRDKGTGLAYALAELELGQLKGALAGAADLAPDLKRYLNENAERLFDGLGSEPSR